METLKNYVEKLVEHLLIVDLKNAQKPQQIAKRVFESVASAATNGWGESSFHTQNPRPPIIPLPLALLHELGTCGELAIVSKKNEPINAHRLVEKFLMLLILCVRSGHFWQDKKGKKFIGCFELPDWIEEAAASDIFPEAKPPSEKSSTLHPISFTPLHRLI
ncbi:MAG: hypothetical protein A3F54_05905 [Candidatus Kerfeldbacteria bacterium RIFCSPHIGHO2_12_FULL_48_17]|uniref:Uncharacterized protein n=1 Tax=Candidatus Kerfeldbacteria bacterium RIFCSPHIGHO2_12_FULL_48_17 TaxID=1798542 RepID=A0A1G2B542_9BACT|nr:MAG: hypothetical protein A3F54_05905 [Candidatus Kerfeldbacteria bacterium RIFCSPHIGHO2_12_FULL_48_17]